MDWLVSLVNAIGVEATIALVVVVIVGMFAAAVYYVAKRGVKDAERHLKDADIIARTVAHQQEQVDELQEDITEHTAERWRLMGRLVEKEEQLKNCQDMLARTGIGGLPATEEKSLREMIVRQQQEITRLREELEIKKGDP